MTKYTKFILGILTTLVFIPLLILILAITFIDPNQYKDKLTDLISAKLHREVEIAGDLEWSLFPLGITINDFKIANDAKFEEKYMLTSGAATLSLELLPILSKTFNINSIYLADTTLSLAKNDKGYSNWESITTANQDNQNNNSKIQDQNKNTDSALPDISIEKIKIVNGTLNWQDADNNIKIEQINLSSKNFSLITNNPFRIDGSFKVILAKQNTFISNDFDCYVTLQKNLQKMNLDLRKLNIELGGKAYPQNPIFNLNSYITVDLTKNYFKISDLKGNLNNIIVSGALEGELNQNNNQIDGQINIAKSNLSDFFEGLNYQHAKNNYQTISGKLNFKTTDQQIVLSPLQIKLDKDDITGEVKIKYSNNSYNIISKLNAKTINIDKLIPPGNQETKPATTDTTNNNKPNKPSSNQKSLLNSINLTATNNINTLIVKNIYVNNFKNTTKFNQGKIDATTTFEAYEGTASTNTYINLNSADPSFAGDFNINKLNLGKLLQVQANTNKLSGTTNLNLQYNTRGNTKNELIRNLDGNIKLNIANGSLRGVDINKLISVLTTKISVNPKDILNSAASTLNFTVSVLENIVTTATGENLSTPINSLTATAVINNGIISNNDLKITSIKSEIQGAGTLDLVKEKINYTVKVQDTPSTGTIARITFPIVIKGHMYSPRYRIGMPTGTLINDTVKSINKVLQKVPVLNQLPLEEINKLPLEKIDELLKF